MKSNLKIILLLLGTVLFSNAKAQTNDPKIQSAKSEILGEWVREDCSDCKIVFTNDMEEKYYINGELIWSYQYDIKRTCDPNKVTMANNLMLITYDEEGNKLGC